MTCPTCTFNFEGTTIEALPALTHASVASVVSLLADDATVGQRPNPDRWSALEYAAHIRDVFLTIRDRSVLGVMEERPHFSPLYREERVALGLYRTDTPTVVGEEVAAAAAMFLRLLDAMDPAFLDREVHYGWPDPAIRTVGWMAKQATHEAQHHLADMRENRELLR